MNHYDIPLMRSSIPLFKEYVDEIRDIWESHWLTNNGIKHKQLETLLKKYLNVPNITLFANGHLALEAAFELFDFPSGSEVITTPFTFASTTHAIVRSNLKPVFCDIDEINYTIDVDLIESLITSKTVAILPVHVYGNICNVEIIDEIAKKYNLKVIYDAAHAFGIEYNGKSIGGFGDVSMFSFHATKVFNTIEGGALCYRNNMYEQKLNNIKDFGIIRNDVVYSGGNAKMNEFEAAMGICNIKHIDNEITKRRELVYLYRKRLSGIKGIRICPDQENVVQNYSYMPIVFDKYKYSRDEIHSILAENRIESRKYFYPVINDYKCYEDVPYIKDADIPVARFISENILTLPLYGELSVENVNKICDLILK